MCYKKKEMVEYESISKYCTCLLTDDTARTSFKVDPTNITFEPFVIPELDIV